MSLLKLCYKNILETSTVTLATGTEDASYPLTRTYDRDVGKIFKSTAAETITVKIDQGAASPLAIDRLLIPAGHTLDGMTLDIKWSDDDGSYTAAVDQWVQSGSGLIDKSWSSITHRYWKFIITAPATAPEFAELFLTQTYTFEENPDQNYGPVDPIWAVKRIESPTGNVRFLSLGDPRKRRAYECSQKTDAQKTSILAFNDAWAGSKPFFFYDHDAVCFYSELIELLNMGADEWGHKFKFAVQEVLP